MNGELTVLEGEYAGRSSAREPVPAEPVVVFAGRHIPEKRVPALVPALALARERIPELRGEIFGDGPEREQVLRLRSEHGLDEALDVPGFVEAERVEARSGAALCMVLPVAARGLRDGRGRGGRAGTPSVVVAAPTTPRPSSSARARTATWRRPPRPRTWPPRSSASTTPATRCASARPRGSAANAERLSLESSLETVRRRATAPPSARR